MLKRYVSPKELSLAVGASESSLKRWADEGALQAVRTAGGHRRIAIDEAVRFIRMTGLKVIDPGAIGLPEIASASTSTSSRTAPADELSAALIEGNGPKAKGLIVSAYLNGQSAGHIMDGLITPALHQIGELWKHDPKGIFIEHRATSLCVEAINQLQSLFPSTASDAPAAVGGALSGDIYTIASLMAATTLVADGWHVTNLGAQTPVESLLLAAEATAAKLIWVSVSVDSTDRKRGKDMEQLVKACETEGFKLIVGGRFAAKLVPPDARSVHWASSMNELAAFAAGLRTK